MSWKTGQGRRKEKHQPGAGALCWRPDPDHLPQDSFQVHTLLLKISVIFATPGDIQHSIQQVIENLSPLPVKQWSSYLWKLSAHCLI